MAEHREPEIWKAIPDYEGLYEVSNYGKVRSLTRKIPHSRMGYVTRRSKILKYGFNSKTGYYKVTLCKKSKLKYCLVHKLVALVFVNNPNKYKTVNHLNQDKSDNYYKNLEWCTIRENTSFSLDKTKTSSKYFGVHAIKTKLGKPWVSGISINGKRKYLGVYETEEEAHQAYLQALKKYNLTNKYAS